jgi:hypothetical protein
MRQLSTSPSNNEADAWRRIERDLMRDGKSRSQARAIIREIKEDEEKWKGGIADENRQA